MRARAGREPEANKYAILYEHKELSRMRYSAIPQILRPTKTDAGGGPETGMQVGMALDTFARKLPLPYIIVPEVILRAHLFMKNHALPTSILFVAGRQIVTYVAACSVLRIL